MNLSHKELREGNLIYQGNQYGISPVSAYQIYQFSLYCKGTKVADYYSEWKPIELTEQWLLDFGYKENDKKFFKKTPYYIEYKGWTPEGFWMMRDIGVPIKLLKYVHSLQNLYFALCETEPTK